VYTKLLKIGEFTRQFFFKTNYTIILLRMVINLYYYKNENFHSIRIQHCSTITTQRNEMKWWRGKFNQPGHWEIFRLAHNVSIWVSLGTKYKKLVGLMWKYNNQSVVMVFLSYGDGLCLPPLWPYVSTQHYSSR